MSHTFYCSTIECDKEVDSYEGVCDSCSKEQMSHETSECPGCGNDIYCGADGYCSNCWVERFGVEDDLSTITHKCSGEWDYGRGILVCDFEDEPACPQHRSEAEIRKNCDCKKSPLCRPCELYYGYADDPYDGCTYDCTNCKRKFKNKYWRNQWLCRDCEDLPPLPPSPVADDLEEQIAAIEEKLKTSMTVDQKADWEFLWHKAKSRQRELGCQGCRDDCLNQQGHMGPGGCLDEPDWADY